jgi:tetratricopeptide (TPR) repeat protein
MQHTISALVMACGVACAGGLAQGASGQWPPDSLENLQVLPESTSVREIVGIMRGIATGLGVRCIHCHVGDDPNDLASTNFVSDEKIEKRKAREMLRMVQRINGELLAAVPERSDPPVEVRCATCHHGVTKPLAIQDILVEKVLSQGVDSAIAEYERLREAYYGSYSYDFRNFVLANVAEEIARRTPDAALRILEYNAERFPESTQTFMMLAQVRQMQGNTEGAIAAVQRLLELDPDNTFFQRMLERLRREP